MGRNLPVLGRLIERSRQEGDCWVWTGATFAPKGDNKARYGLLSVNGENEYVHRLMVELVLGEIPQGLFVDHLCRNTLCINPFHLEAVSNKENVLRGTGHTAVNAAKTHCKRGHAFDAENTGWHAGKRFCRACMALHGRKSPLLGPRKRGGH